MSYTHITQEQRVELAALMRAKVSQKQIALQLGKDRTSLWRERKRNIDPETKRGYHAGKAQRATTARRTLANYRFRKIEHNPELEKYIQSKLKDAWTPEEIAGTLRENFGFTVLCHETIYQYIYATRPEWAVYLRHKKNKYRRRHGTKTRVKYREEGKKKRIDTRPHLIEERTRIGDFEGDTIVGKEKTKRILTLVDRKSGLLLASKLETGKAIEVREQTKRLLRGCTAKNLHTITLDNGTEFSEYELMERDNKVSIYFAYPYHSWERGTNENTNGLLRQFFPKGTPFATITQKEIDRVVNLINTRPRKRHQYRTPLEVWNECCTLD